MKSSLYYEVFKILQNTLRISQGKKPTYPSCIVLEKQMAFHFKRCVWFSNVIETICSHINNHHFTIKDFENWCIYRYLKGNSWIPSLKEIEVKRIKSISLSFSKKRFERDKIFLYSLSVATGIKDDSELIQVLEGVGESILFRLFKSGNISMLTYIKIASLNSISDEHSTEEQNHFNERVRKVCKLLYKNKTETQNR